MIVSRIDAVVVIEYGGGCVWGGSLILPRWSGIYLTSLSP